MTGKGVVAVIGGGVAGLAAAGLLARSGLRVVVFEANWKVGGCCGNTVVEGYTFNDGALYLAFPGVLDRVFEKLDGDRASLVPLRRITALQTTTLPDGSVVTVRDGGRVTVRRGDGSEVPARVQDGVDHLLERWGPVFRIFADDLLVHPLSLPRLVTRSWRHLHKLRGNVAAELRSLFPDEAVRSAMSGALLFTGVPPEDTPAPALLGLIALLSDGFYIPEGGMGRIPEALRESLEDAGGEVVAGTRVRRIVSRNGRAVGVATDSQGLVEVDAVVSTVHGSATCDILLEDADVSERMRRKSRNAPLSHKALAVQLGLSNEVDDGVSHTNGVLPWMDDQAEVFHPDVGHGKWLNYSVPTVTMPELAPAGGSIIEAYPSIPQELPVDDWDELRSRHFVDSTVARLSRMHPLEIAVTRILTPRTFRDELHLHAGAVYGLSPAADPRAHFPHRTPVAGLYQAGQTTYPGFGVASAAMSGILAAEALIVAERI